MFFVLNHCLVWGAFVVFLSGWEGGGVSSYWSGYTSELSNIHQNYLMMLMKDCPVDQDDLTLANLHLLTNH